MAPYGELKCNSLVYETGSGDVTVNVSTIPPGNNPVFTGDVTLTGSSANVVFDASDDALEFAANAKATFGNTDLKIWHDGSHGYLDNDTGWLYVGSDNHIFQNKEFNETYARFLHDGAVELYENGTKRFETSSTGATITGTLVSDGLTVAGDSSFTGQSDFTGHLKEAVTVTAGKLSDNTNLDIESGNVFLFTTAESTTSTPNLRYNGSTALGTKMAIGDCLSVTIITTANASAYSAQLKIDGGDVVENWTGGSAPSAGGSSGLDIHAYTIIKTAATGTSQNDYKVIANFTKTS